MGHHTWLAGAPNAAGAPVNHAAAGADFRTELAQAKRREAEASTRVAALEAKLKSSSSGFGEMQASVQELTHRVQVCQPQSLLGHCWVTAGSLLGHCWVVAGSLLGHCSCAYESTCAFIKMADGIA